MSMTKEERDEARKRIDAAEGGPWDVAPSEEYGNLCDIYSPGECLFLEKIWHADAKFIAHARTDLPRALDELDAKDAEIERLHAERDMYRNRVTAREDSNLWPTA